MSTKNNNHPGATNHAWVYGLLFDLHAEISLSHALLLLVAFLLFFLLLRLLCKPNDGHGNGKSIPSPPAIPVIGHLHLLKKPLHRSLSALAARYDVRGTGLLLLRFGSKPVLLVSSPAVAQECFTVHDVALADRPGLASRRLLTDDCPTIATASYGPLWRHLRRFATVHALSPHRLSLTAAARDAEARPMARRLYRGRAAAVAVGVKAAAAVGVKAAAYEFVVNVIMAMVAGRRMGEEDVLRFKAITEAGFTAAGAANRHDFLPVLRLLDFGRSGRRLAGLAKQRHEFGQSIVDDYRRLHGHRVGSDETVPRTVIGDLLRQQERSPESYDDVVIRTVCLSLLRAGTDTLSSTIEWAMALLLNNPLAMEKATAEIDTVVGTSRLLQECDLAALPYLRCVVTETLRLYPLAPHLVPHEASHDCTLTSTSDTRYTIKRGTMMLVDVYSMQRDPAAWEDSGKFVPEMFADTSDDNEIPMMMSFRMGRRKCPGEGLAWRTVGVALGVMVQCFEWDRMGKEEVDMSEGSGLTVPMVMPLVASCRPRQEMGEVLRGL